jgi:outer membrane protein OmpA-like peptidoglycan-associated protein
VFLAGLCSAAIAGGAVYLATLGQVTAPATESFRFVRGVGLAPGEEQRLKAYLLDATRDDRIDLTIVGHSGTSGDVVANQDLSEARAMVAAEIAESMGIGADRIVSFGMGGDAAFARPEGVSERTWQAELARVEVTLQVRR